MRCQVCDRPLPEGRLRNCSRACTVYAAGRRFHGELYDPERARQAPERDWILSRILWLGGLQPGVNQGGDVDSFRRFIYIHGTPDDQPMGEPASHGCIRMRNTDVITLFERVPVGTPVTIVE